MRLRLWAGDKFDVKETRALTFGERLSGVVSTSREVKVVDFAIADGRPSVMVEFQEERRAPVASER
jgi:hypothetical protein